MGWMLAGEPRRPLRKKITLWSLRINNSMCVCNQKDKNIWRCKLQKSVKRQCCAIDLTRFNVLGLATILFATVCVSYQITWCTKTSRRVQEIIAVSHNFRQNYYFNFCSQTNKEEHIEKGWYCDVSTFTIGYLVWLQLNKEDHITKTYFAIARDQQCKSCSRRKN